MRRPDAPSRNPSKLRNDKMLPVWGSDAPRREFLYVEDLADACVRVMQTRYDGPLVNIDTCTDVSIRELAELVMKVVDLSGRITYDTSKPDGTPRKLLDVSRLAALGWRARTALRDGITLAHADFVIRSNALA